MRLDPTILGIRISLLAALSTPMSGCGGSQEEQSESGAEDTANESGEGEGTGEGSGSEEDTGEGSGSEEDTGSGEDTGGETTGSEEGDDLCQDPVPVIDGDGNDTGYLKCADGTIHRAMALDCDPTIDTLSCGGTEDNKECEADSDCTDGPNGKCVTGINYAEYEGQEDRTYCRCEYACERDEDCGVGEVCVCNEVVETGISQSSCQPANCQTDADCESGECGISSYNDGCTDLVGLACRSSQDACRLHDECSSENLECAIDTYSGSLTWACRDTQECAAGRFLMIEGEVRKASVDRRGDWIAAGASPRLDRLSPAMRELLAERWQKIAAIEHASIASFARFTFQLMALGAPPDLLSETQRAADDEIEHARIAYALASAYTGQQLGPGPLSLGDLSIESDPKSVVRGLIKEACIGETIGASEAQLCAGEIEDPALRAAYLQIASDELRHAQLAWRSLKWILDEGDKELRSFAEKLFAETVVEYEESLNERRDDRDLHAPAHGIFDRKTTVSMRRAALEEIVIPCAREILGRAVGHGDQKVLRIESKPYRVLC